MSMMLSAGAVTASFLPRNDDRAQVASYSSRWQAFGQDVLWTRTAMSSGQFADTFLSYSGQNIWDPSVRLMSESKAGQRRDQIIGITKDASGVALGNCAVDLFDTTSDVKVDSVVSDASGIYAATVVWMLPYAGQQLYAVAYKAGAPDVAGTTVNTLVGS
jgi:hypothetical protein